MRRILALIAPFTIILGTFIIALGISGINGLSIITPANTQIGNYTWWYYKIDLYNYLINIKNSINGIKFETIFTNTPKAVNYNTDNVLGAIKAVYHTILYGLNWVIYVLNIIVLAPVKILIYPVWVMMSLLGLNTSSNEAIQAITLLYSFGIPYIPYV